jgi:hypothetical protein
MGKNLCGRENYGQFFSAFTMPGDLVVMHLGFQGGVVEPSEPTVPQFRRLVALVPGHPSSFMPKFITIPRRGRRCHCRRYAVYWISRPNFLPRGNNRFAIAAASFSATLNANSSRHGFIQ